MYYELCIMYYVTHIAGSQSILCLSVSFCVILLLSTLTRTITLDKQLILGSNHLLFYFIFKFSTSNGGQELELTVSLENISQCLIL